MDSTNTQEPFLGQSDPLYPNIEEICEVDGPALAGTNTYPAWIVQFAPDPRRRVRAYVTEPNNVKLGPAYYDGRLVDNFNGLPRFVTTCCVTGSFSSSSQSSSSSSSSSSH